MAPQQYKVIIFEWPRHRRQSSLCLRNFETDQRNQQKQCVVHAFAFEKVRWDCCVFVSVWVSLSIIDVKHLNKFNLINSMPNFLNLRKIEQMTTTTKTNKQINSCPVNILCIKLDVWLPNCKNFCTTIFVSKIFEFCSIEKLIKTFERIQYVYYVKSFLVSAESLILNVKKKKNTKWNVINEIKKQ